MASEERTRSTVMLGSSQSTRQLVVPTLTTKREKSESRTIFIDSIRDYLRKEISIVDKKVETKKLAEFITNEHEKLKMSIEAFEVDKKHFMLYKMRLNQEVEKIENDVKRLTLIKTEKDEEIMNIKQKIFGYKSQCLKIDEAYFRS